MPRRLQLAIPEGRKLRGVVTAVYRNGQTVETVAEEHYLKSLFLLGRDKISGNVSVGDKVELDYRKGRWSGHLLQHSVVQDQSTITYEVIKDAA